MANKEAEKILKDDLGVKSLRSFPRDITIAYNDSKHILTMTLLPKAVGLGKGDAVNMQDNAAAFEAWCFIIKAKTSIDDLKIKLDVEGLTSDMYDKDIPSTGHFGRFLYRILKFKEQYGTWFFLSDELEDMRKNFADFLSSGKFVNNEPSKEAEDDEDALGTEGYVEKRFCDDDSLGKLILGFSGENVVINRQLPVGLFKGEKSDGTAVFTGKKSAIDFWLLYNNELNIYELKANNKMVGILTEIFFYSNYMRDVYWHNSLETKQNVRICNTQKTDRSYNKLCNGIKNITKITGCILADEFHPLITDAVISIMNHNGTENELQYDKKQYDLKIDIPVHKKE
ncbi:hypothetical protein [Phascolarctobacterium succinatutens]|uniref:hypothetical protein n=1 Tax=Phascolarctobacterium succinatutens TaxID=626940 RepID=UPI0023EF5897|nr:hypothetical protein [Phascolarctobacterium succinatutens]